MSYTRLNLKNGTTFTEDHVSHIEDGIERACSVMVNEGVQNICDPTKFKSGYNGDTLAYHTWDTTGANTIYSCIFPDIKVKEGEIITCWKKDGTLIDFRFVSAFDELKNKLVNSGMATGNMYVVPKGVYYIAVTINNTIVNINDVCIQKANTSKWLGYTEPLKDVFKINPDSIKSSTPDGVTLHVYLPSELCIPQGQTIELYNRNACLESDRYHVQWVSKYGTAYPEKLSIAAGESQTPETFTITMNILNDKLDILESRTCTAHIVSKEIVNKQVIIPIGDSLTNTKYWQTHLRTLSNSKIEFRGSKGHTAKAYNPNGFNHEGRSGAGTGWYNVGTSKYTFEASSTTAIRETGSYAYLIDANGNSIDPVQGNPFWRRNSDGSINRFDFDWYCNSRTDGGAGIFHDENSNEISITPTGVIIYLGANGLALDSSKGSNDIVTLVELIQNSTKGSNIPIYIVNTAFRAPYITTTTADGFATNSSGEYGYLNEMKNMNLEIALNERLKTYNNVYFMPVCATFDAIHNYPYTEVPVNPYVTSPTRFNYTDTIHPASSAPYSGYKQMAVTMFGAILKHQI